MIVDVASVMSVEETDSSGVRLFWSTPSTDDVAEGSVDVVASSAGGTGSGVLGVCVSGVEVVISVVVGVITLVEEGVAHWSHQWGVPISCAPASKPYMEFEEIQLVARNPSCAGALRTMLVFFGEVVPANGAPPSPARSITVPFPSSKAMAMTLFEREMVVVTTSGGSARVDFTSVSA